MAAFLNKYTRLVLVISALLVSCSQERSLSPLPDDWVVYVAGWGTKQIYVLDADSLNIVDSIPFARPASAMVPSPDGSMLYIMIDDWDSPPGSYIIDTKSKKVVAYVSESTGLPRLARHGQILFRGRMGVDHVYLCDPHTYQILDSLEDGLRVYDVLNGGDTLLVEDLASSTLRLYDLTSRNRFGAYQTRASRGDSSIHEYIWNAVIDPTGLRVVVGAGGGFEIGNIMTGEMLAMEQSLLMGGMDVSPDGRFCAASAPGESRSFWRPRFWLFDLRGATIMTTLGTGDWSDSLHCGGWPGFLPGSKRVLIGAFPRLDSGPLQVFDIDAGRITKWIWLPAEDPDVRCFAIGRATD